MSGKWMTSNKEIFFFRMILFCENFYLRKERETKKKKRRNQSERFVIWLFWPFFSLCSLPTPPFHPPFPSLPSLYIVLSFLWNDILYIVKRLCTAVYYFSRWHFITLNYNNWQVHIQMASSPFFLISFYKRMKN